MISYWTPFQVYMFTYAMRNLGLTVLVGTLCLEWSTYYPLIMLIPTLFINGERVDRLAKLS